jgi:hypothetical protein
MQAAEQNAQNMYRDAIARGADPATYKVPGLSEEGRQSVINEFRANREEGRAITKEQREAERDALMNQRDQLIIDKTRQDIAEGERDPQTIVKAALSAGGYSLGDSVDLSSLSPDEAFKLVEQIYTTKRAAMVRARSATSTAKTDATVSATVRELQLERLNNEYTRVQKVISSSKTSSGLRNWAMDRMTEIEEDILGFGALLPGTFYAVDPVTGDSTIQRVPSTITEPTLSREEMMKFLMDEYSYSASALEKMDDEEIKKKYITFSGEEE